MRAAVWSGVRKVEVKDVPEPKILNDHDAIVRITSTAICGSDLHLYNGLVPTMQKGDILGHEFMGDVVEVGSRVERLNVGDRVVVPFPIACGACSQCQAGNFSACENSNPNGWMSERNSTCSSERPLGILIGPTSANGTRTYSACPPA